MQLLTSLAFLVFFSSLMVARGLFRARVFSTRRILALRNSVPTTGTTVEQYQQQIQQRNVKRKLAVVVSYVGTNYYGLQMDTNSTLDTIERRLESALYDCGCILDSNRGKLQKIGWSRSSRTDKGVSCARMVISAKLEIDFKQWENNRAPLQLIQMLNDKLPHDIRVHAICKVNQGFRAREACHWREYEYVLPLRLLTKGFVNTTDHGSSKSWSSPPTTAQEAIDRLNQVLRKYENTHSFHNFHKLAPKDLRKKAWKEKPKPFVEAAIVPKVRVEAEEREANEEDEEEEVEVASAVPPQEQKQTNFFEPSWVRRDREICSKTRGTIYLCQAEMTRNVVMLNEDGKQEEETLVIRIRGQSFLLHQIRLMVGAAILVARGILPEVSVDVALVAPYHVNFPMAPAEGLLLVNAGFGRNSDTYALSSISDKEAQCFLMSEEEYELSEQFKVNRIYPQLVNDWRKDDWALQREFLLYSERFVCGQQAHDEFVELLVHTNASDSRSNNIREEKEVRRVIKAVADFRKHLLHLDENFSAYFDENRPERCDKDSAFRCDPFPHKRLLPNTLATELVLNFEQALLPGSPVVTDILRVLATKMVLLELEPTASAKELAELVKMNGGLQHWQSMPKHRLID